MEALLAFRSAVINDKDGFTLLKDDEPAELKDATTLRLTESGQKYDLSIKTAFKSASSEVNFIDLRTIVNCWQCRDLSVPQYIATSDELGISNLKFLERTDLLEWLDGTSTNSEYIQVKGSLGTSGSAPDEDFEMPDLTGVQHAVSVDRGALANHMTSLQGQKLNDFAHVAALCHKSIVLEFRAPLSGKQTNSFGKNASSTTATLNPGMVPLKPVKGKDPIILLSPSPSSLLNMGNVQSFLENGTFLPTLKSSNSSNLLRVTRSSKLIGPKTRFIVVDSVDHFKPDYWDRVVAVFVTGQFWQLRSYKWQDPNSLFHHVLGFGLVYRNDPVPELLKKWNVKIEALERTTRFRDREVVERIWDRIEAHMIARGWPTVNGAH